jgi:hypothetical protein
MRYDAGSVLGRGIRFAIAMPKRFRIRARRERRALAASSALHENERAAERGVDSTFWNFLVKGDSL